MSSPHTFTTTAQQTCPAACIPQVVQLVCKAFRDTLAVPASSNTYGVLTITPREGLCNFRSWHQLIKWLTQRQNGETPIVSAVSALHYCRKITVFIPGHTV